MSDISERLTQIHGNLIGLNRALGSATENGGNSWRTVLKDYVSPAAQVVDSLGSSIPQEDQKPSKTTTTHLVTLQESYQAFRKIGSLSSKTPLNPAHKYRALAAVSELAYTFFQNGRLTKSEATELMLNEDLERYGLK